jgi:hypothetical protein
MRDGGAKNVPIGFAAIIVLTLDISPPKMKPNELEKVKNLGSTWLKDQAFPLKTWLV